MINKKFCSIHHFTYTTVECPFCLKERTDRLVKKNEKKDVKQQNSNQTKQEDIFNKLKTKYKVTKL